MRKAPLIYVALFGLAGALGGVVLLLHNSGWAQVRRPPFRSSGRCLPQ